MISIIVPVHNSEKTLKMCVDSICHQTFSKFELIIIDDGSTDGSSQLCDQIAKSDSRIKVIHKANGGVSSARNAGIAIADGEYITFCDSDDYLEPDYIESLLKVADVNPDAGHIWCCFQTVTGYEKENAKPNCSFGAPVLYYSINEYMTLHELWLDTGPWNKLYRTKVIRDANLHFAEDMSLGEDWLFNLDYLDASENNKIAVITKPLYNYVRASNESLDTKYRDDLIDIYRRLNNACLSHLEKWNISEDQMKIFYNSRFYLYEKVLRNTMRSPDKSKREKIEWNNAFMRGTEFKEVLDSRSCFVHPLYLAAYRSGNFGSVLILDRLQKIKKSFSRKR